MAQATTICCGAQVDQVTDTDEDRIDAVLRAQHPAAPGASQGWHGADRFAVVDQRCGRAASRSRLTMRPVLPATPPPSAFRFLGDVVVLIVG